MGIRNEGVHLTLIDDYSTGMAKVAATTALANRELRDLDGTSGKTAPSLTRLAEEANRVPPALDRTSASSRRASADINQFSGRLSLAVQALTAVAPAALPIGAAAVPALTSLASAAGAVGVAAGTTMLAFRGFGDALSDLNKAKLDPTAENMEKARQSLEHISPAARQFAFELQAMQPALEKLQASTGADLFPGLARGLQGAITVLPQVRGILKDVGGAVGNLGEMTGASLASGKWDEFLTFLRATVPAALEDLGHSAANVAGAMAELWMAFGPLNDGILDGLVDATQSLEEWATGLSASNGFQEFIAYIQETAPQAGATLLALGDAGLQIIEAFAPLGGPTLRILETFADLIATIADSPIGTPLAAIATALSTLSLLNKGLQSTKGLLAGLGGAGAAAGAGAAGGGIGDYFQENAEQIKAAAGTMRASFTGVGTTLRQSLGQGLAPTTGQMGLLRARMTEVGAASRQLGGAVLRGGAPLAAMGLMATGTADKLHLNNTAMLAMTGSMTGPWGTAIGAGVGALLDLKTAGDQATDGLQGINAALNSGSAEKMKATYDDAKKEMQDLANVDWSSGKDIFGDLSARLSMNLGNGPKNITDQAAAVDKLGAATAKQTEIERVNAQAQAELANYTSTTNTALYDQNAAMAESIKVMQEQHDAAIRAIDGQLGYKSAILDAKDALKENGSTLDLNTREGIANMGALKSLAAAWNGQSDAAKNAKGSMQAAKANFVDTAVAMGKGEVAAKGLANRLFEIPPARVTTYRIETTAEQKIAALNTELNNLAKPRFANIYVNIRKPNAGGFGPQIGNSADGGEVVGAPRHPYGDKVLYALAPGEEIISNRHGQADLFRAHRAAGLIPGYADGGTTGEDDLTAATKKVNAARKRAAARSRTRSRARGAYGDLDVDVSTHADGLTHALDEFTDDVDRVRDLFKDAGLHLIKAQRDQIDDLRRAARELDGFSTALKQTKDAQADYAQQVAGSINHDIFGNGLAGAQSALDADTNDATAMLTALSAAVMEGLDGPTLQALAASGDLTTAQQLAAGGAGVIGNLETSYGNRYDAQQALGAYAGQQVYGAQISQQTAEVVKQTAAINRMEQSIKQQSRALGDLGGQVRDGARQGTAQGGDQQAITAGQRSGQKSKTDRRGGRWAAG